MKLLEARRHAREGTTVHTEIMIPGTDPRLMTVAGTLAGERRGYGSRTVFTVEPTETLPDGAQVLICRAASELWT